MTMPVATYRLQFRNGMTFDRAVEIVPYLKRLGISHLYASPIFTATTGSTHGYDVTNHGEIDPAIGGREGFERLSSALRAHGLGLVLDIVPNHMAASLENPWWRSVVRHGRESPYASHFDIDWSERLTLPILGQTFADALAADELRIAIDRHHREIALGYFDTLLPLDEGSLPYLASRLGMQSVPDARSMTVGEMDAFDARLVEASRDWALLSALHDLQPWILTFWKDARRHLTYRRFFEVTGLVGVRVEDDKVFDDVHRFALSLVREGKVDGLRIDHVDGLARPASYLRRLRSGIGPERLLVVEKILGDDETVPGDWSNSGTTGYEFMPAMADLLVDAGGAGELTAAFGRLRGLPVDVTQEERAAKRLILNRNFEGELDRLTSLSAPLSPGIEQPVLKRAIGEIIVGFDIYRTYGEDGAVSAQDAAHLDHAVAAARAGLEADPVAVGHVGELLRNGEARACEFRERFQQLTGPVTAKSVEDTLFYRLNALISLNEVGASPGQRICGPSGFHERMARIADAPMGLIATATHDTKRGEDARARLHAISEIAPDWIAATDRWRGMNEHLRADEDLPDAQTDWMAMQMLAGIWPDEDGVPAAPVLAQLADRLAQAVEKALREAKLRTDWLEIDDDYERAVLGYVRSFLSLSNTAFLSDFAETMIPIRRAGRINALSQTLAKLTAPGIPDIYQGSELADFSLVDPDNRRPVDWEKLDEALAAKADKPDMIAQVLAMRRRAPELFTHGSYAAIETDGHGHAAYLREHDGTVALVILRRMPLTTSDETVLKLPPHLHGAEFRNVLTGSTANGAATVPAAAFNDGHDVSLSIATTLG